MKSNFLLFRFLLFSVVSYGQTQGEMNQNAKSNYLKVDKELNAAYQRILIEYKEDNTFIKNFKAAQRLWVQFRDAEMKAKFPNREEGYYGSVQPMCWFTEMTILTNERLGKIKIWLTGVKEGDVCSGSVKTID
jgi:uncharacterized protein YecT (DUF1311 family)